MRILICGAGSTGCHVGRVLAEVHDITIIDVRPERPPLGDTEARFVAGDAADPAVLMQAGAGDADALVAVTHDDALNLTIALVAKRRFGVPSIVARVGDPAHRWLYVPEAGVDIAVSTAEVVARLVQEEVTAGDLVTLLRLRGPGVAVTETTLPPGAAVAGRAAADVAFPDGVALTAVVRGGHVVLPDGAGALRGGDVVVALCEPGREHLLHDLLTSTDTSHG